MSRPGDGIYYRFVWLAFIAFGSVGVGAQDSDKERPLEASWYHIEMIVLGRLDATSDEEIFPEYLQLSYPQYIQHLGPSREQRLAEEQQRQLSLEAEVAAGIAPPALLAAPDEAPPDETENPAAYEQLDEDIRLLNATADSLRNSRNYRVLFHQAWRQPLPERPNMSQILVTGGERFDEHYELEGHISLARSRYLHLATQLWLNRFVAVDDWQGQTQTLPKIPSAPPPAPALSDTQESMLLLEGADEERAVVVTLGPNGVPTFSDPALATPGAGPPVYEEEETIGQYAAAQSWLLAQKRRLRSTELHYLDHPRFGVLVYAEPWRPAEEED